MMLLNVLVGVCEGFLVFDSRGERRCSSQVWGDVSLLKGLTGGKQLQGQN